MSAYQNDDSEESKSKIQQIKVDLEDAKKELADTEYDQAISDIEKLLDSMYDEYELILNQRLDNIDALIMDMITEINSNSSLINETISAEANNVGYTLSDSMNTIWNSENSVLTYYGDGFLNSMTGVNTALNNINTNIKNMMSFLDSWAKQDAIKAENSSASNSTQANSSPAPAPTPDTNSTPSEPVKQITIGGKINAGNATIYATSGGAGGSTQYFGYDPIYTVLDEQNGYVLARYHKLSSGYTGWFRKSDVSAYATGKKRIGEDELAWTQEEGSEMIVRPSDGAILTPLAKNDSVLNASASRNIWDMANNPSDFMRDNLGVNSVDSPTHNGGNSTYTQYFDKVEFVLPNVQNYDQLLRSMQKDRNFERLISSMTIDRVVGKNSTIKSKAIR